MGIALVPLHPSGLSLSKPISCLHIPSSRTHSHTRAYTLFNRNTLHEYNLPLSLSQFRFSKCCVPWLSLAVGWRWGRNLEPSWNSTEKGKQILSKKIKFVLFSLFPSPSVISFLSYFFVFVLASKRNRRVLQISSTFFKENTLVTVFKFLRILPLRRRFVF